MTSPRDVLTPDSLAMLQVIADTGSFAAAARHLGLVPSALTYRVRQMEEALDVLLFDRSARQAHATEAGKALLHESARLLQDLDSVAHRVRRVATGWEPQLTIVTDGVIAQRTLLDLVDAFYALQPPTRLQLRSGILSGTLETLTSGKADLAIGVAVNASNVASLQTRELGEMEFCFAVAPFHPLAAATEPITDATLLTHRQVVAADSGQRESTSMGLIDGQDMLTVESIQAKVDAQLRGLGCGFLPMHIVRPYEEAGLLVTRPVSRPTRHVRLLYAWTPSPRLQPGRALQWWLQQLDSPTTRRALLENHQPLHHGQPLQAPPTV